MSEANAGGVGGLFLLRASQSPPTRLASLATLPANGREGKDPAPSIDVCNEKGDHTAALTSNAQQGLAHSAAMRTSGAAARTSASTWLSKRTKLSRNMRTSFRAVWSNSALSFQVLNG